MASSILAPRAVDFTVELIQNTLRDLAEKSPYGLEDSIHAPANIRRQRQHFHASNSKQSNSSKNINASNKSLAHRNSYSPSTSISGKGRKQAGAMAGYSKLDDTAGFMDAVRRRNIGTTRTSANVPARSDSGTHAEQNIRKSMNDENSSKYIDVLSQPFLISKERIDGDVHHSYCTSWSHIREALRPWNQQAGK